MRLAGGIQPVEAFDEVVRHLLEESRMLGQHAQELPSAGVVHQGAAHPLTAVEIVEHLLGFPEVSYREVGLAGRGGEVAFGAALVLVKASVESRDECVVVVHLARAVVEPDDHGPVWKAFPAEQNVLDLLAFGLLPEVLLEHRLGRESGADEVDGVQVLALSDEHLEGADMAGESEEEDHPAAVETFFDVLVHGSHVADDIFRSVHPGDDLSVVGQLVDHVEIVVVDRSAHASVVAEGPVGQHVEHSSRGAPGQDAVLGDEGVAPGLLHVAFGRFGVQSRASLHAFAAVDAKGWIHGRSEEPSFVRDDADRILRTRVDA